MVLQGQNACNASPAAISEAAEEQISAAPAAVSQSQSIDLLTDAEAVGSAEPRMAPAQKDGSAAMHLELTGTRATSACEADAVHPAHKDGTALQQPRPPSIVQDGASQVDVHCNPLFGADEPIQPAHSPSNEDLATLPPSISLPLHRDRPTSQKRRSARPKSGSSAIADGSEQVSLQSTLARLAQQYAAQVLAILQSMHCPLMMVPAALIKLGRWEHLGTKDTSSTDAA